LPVLILVAIGVFVSKRISSRHRPSQLLASVLHLFGSCMASGGIGGGFGVTARRHALAYAVLAGSVCFCARQVRDHRALPSHTGHAAGGARDKAVQRDLFSRPGGDARPPLYFRGLSAASRAAALRAPTSQVSASLYRSGAPLIRLRPAGAEYASSQAALQLARRWGATPAGTTSGSRWYLLACLAEPARPALSQLSLAICAGQMD